MRDQSAAGAVSAAPTRRSWSGWTWVTAFELVLAGAAILLDLGIPSVFLLLLAAVSLAVRRQGPASLGVHRAQLRRLVPATAGFAVLWSLFQLTVTMPITEHVSGEEQHAGVFEEVHGDIGLLVILLLLSWTLGAVVEELAFRGYLLTRFRELLGSGRVGLVSAIAASSLLFGALHSEQGIVGVVAVALDGVAFCLLRLYYGTVWASVLAHGFNNTLGLVTYFLIGPVYGLW